MISHFSLPALNSPPSAPPASIGAPGGQAPESNAPTHTDNSFQQIFAQAVTPDALTSRVTGTPRLASQPLPAAANSLSASPAKRTNWLQPRDFVPAVAPETLTSQADKLSLVSQAQTAAADFLSAKTSNKMAGLSSFPPKNGKAYSAAKSSDFAPTVTKLNLPSSSTQTETGKETHRGRESNTAAGILGGAAATDKGTVDSAQAIENQLNQNQLNQNQAQQNQVMQNQLTENQANDTQLTKFSQSIALQPPVNLHLSNFAADQKSPATDWEQNRQAATKAFAISGLNTSSGTAFGLHITPGANQIKTPPSLPSATSGSSDQATSESKNPNDTVAPPAGPLAAGNAHAPVNPNSITTLSGEPAPLSFWAQAEAAGGIKNRDHLVPSEAAAASATPATAETADSAVAPQAVRSVQVQLAGEGTARVDLRLVERDGGLSVSVRASDSTLTRGLQDNLPELTARLEADKYETHTFLPSVSAAASADSSSNFSGQSSRQAHDQSNNNASSQGGSGSGSGRQSGGQSGGQPGGQSSDPQDPTSAWWRQMAALGKLSAGHSVSVSNSQASPSANSD